MHWPVPLAEVTSKPVRFFASLLFLASASSSQTPGQTSEHKEIHISSTVSILLAADFDLDGVTPIEKCGELYKRKIHQILRNTAWKKRHESMFNSFSFVVGLMGDGGEDLQGARCFLKRPITSFFT